MVQLQFTIFSSKGYKPISTIMEVESIDYYYQHSKDMQKKAIEKICNKRYMQAFHLKQYGYGTIKVRVYDKEKIDKENAKRYEELKKEKGWT